jgi:hypothetical protein
MGKTWENHGKRETMGKPWENGGNLQKKLGELGFGIYWDFYGIFNDDLNGKWIVYSLDSSLWRVVSKGNPEANMCNLVLACFHQRSEEKGSKMVEATRMCGLLLPISRHHFCICLHCQA